MQLKETEKLTITKILQIAVPIAGVTVAAISLLLTLGARKKELTSAYLGVEKVVSLDVVGNDPSLKIEYRNQPISSLLKLKYVLRNTGGAAIRAEDIKEPIRLNFPQDVRLLNSVVDRTLPSEFTFTATVIPKENAVECNFLLLNSGDEAFFSVYVYNSTQKKPQLRGRVVDVLRILDTDESANVAAVAFPFISGRSMRKAVYVLIFLFNSLFIVFFLILTIVSLSEFIRLMSWNRKWKATTNEIEADLKGKVDASSLPGELAKALTSKGVPPKPTGALYGTWKGFLGVNLVWLVLISGGVLTLIFFWNNRSSI